MLKLMDKEASSRRLILGFDAGCWSCSELAKRIEEQVGDKLEVMSLRDLRVQEWREKALGGDAPWVPTLIEVKDFKVRAWTGLRLGMQLGSSLGPVTTWRVMQVLGELGPASKAEESTAAKVSGGLSRRQFLKGVGGAVVAMTALSGTSKLARQAEAATLQKSTELSGSTLVELARKRAKTADMINVGGSTWANRLQNGAITTLSKTVNGRTEHWTIIAGPDGDSSQWKASGELYVSPGSTATKAAKHKYSDGNTMTAVVYLQSDGQLMYSYKYATAIKGGGLKSRAGRYKWNTTTEKYKSKAESVNGRLVTTTSTASAEFTASSSCGSCYDDVYYEDWYCEDWWSWGNATLCGLCGVSCYESLGITCAACSIVCPLSYFYNCDYGYYECYICRVK